MFNAKEAVILESFTEDKMKEFAECKICKGIIINPVRCLKCNCNFCKSCAEKILSTSQTCPSGCTPFNFIPSKLMKRLLSSLKFKCKNGCDKEIAYDEFDDHYCFKCDKADFKTKFEKEYQKREDEKTKFEELSKTLMEKINLIKADGTADITEDKMNRIFVSKYHLHPLEKDIFRNGFKCCVCMRYIERNSEKYFCDKCRFVYCDLCKIEELKENQSH